MTKVFSLLSIVSTISLVGQVAAQAKDISCKYLGVQYGTVAPPDLTDNWMMVESVLVECEGYSSIGYIGPFNNPSNMTFSSSNSRTLVIQNQGFNLNNILIGDQFPDGRDANEFINSILKKEWGTDFKGVALTAVSIDAKTDVFANPELRQIIQNPHYEDPVKLLMRQHDKDAATISKKYGLNPGHNYLSLTGLDYMLTEASGAYQCVIDENAPNAVGIQKEFGTNFYHHDIRDLLLKSWSLTLEDCQNSKQFVLEKGKRVQ